MSIVNAVPLLEAAGGDYQISRSVRLRSSASAYFSRTPAVASNRRTWTWSGWVKLGKLSTSGSDQAIFTAGYSTSPWFVMQYQGGSSAGTFQIAFTAGVSGGCFTNAIYRDPSAWYHVVLAVDTTQATDTNRVKFYVNGVQQSFASTAYPSQNYDTQVNNTVSHTVGGYSGSYVDGYLTEVNFIDGQALTASSFGETNPVTGVWQPKKYAGTYGTNGFYLNFSDNSAATAAAIGKDMSGNANNWTPNNISVTAGVTYDSMLDTPTPYADGGNGRGNYAVLNPVDVGYNAATSEANLKVSTASAGNAAAASTIALTTNTYWEVTIGSNTQVGLIWGRASDAYGNSSLSMFANGATGSLVNATRTLSATPSWSNGDTLGFAWNNSTRVLTLYQAGSATAVMTMTTPATGDPQVAITNYSSGATMSAQVNFGQRPFTYTPPTGFKALNTQNLPDATVKKGNQYFDATTYTGNGGSNTITSGLSNIDFLWVKQRSSTNPASHSLFDVVRGDNNILRTNGTDAENAAGIATGTYGGATGLGTSTITLTNGTDPTFKNTNGNGYTYVGWQWKKGATQGFDIVTYTGDGTSGRTVAHSLGVAPSMMIVKARVQTGARNWAVWHKALAGTEALYLNSTSGKATELGYWNSTTPSSSVITLGGNNDTNGGSSQTYVAYLFAEVAGFSKFGSYTGNGSADGPFVYLGFRPRYVLTKCSSLGSLWAIWDTSRNTYNAVGNVLQANASDAEVSPYNIDVLSNGFKFRDTNSNWNGSGNTYIYAAFAENPTKYALAR